MTPAQCRAARGLLDWSQAELAKRSNVSLSAVKNFEGGRSAPMANNLAALVRALEGGDVLLIAENGGGPGVRLAKSSRSSAGSTAHDAVAQAKAHNDVRTGAADAVDRVLADVDATKQEKAERRGALTDEPAVIGKARGKGQGKKL